MKNAIFILPGILFGLALAKGEAISWFRIQEMARFQGFQLYGIFLTANLVSLLGLLALRRFGPRSPAGEPLAVARRAYHHGQPIGGLVFGVGFALSGACPGPLYVQLGAGIGIAAVVLLSALAGTWTYAWLRPRLPH